MSLYYKIKMIKKYGIRDGIIYIQIAPNGKKYIGQTINHITRFKTYKQESGNNPHHTNALCKYGYGAFVIQTFKVPEFLLNSVEKSLIIYYQTTDPKKGYNKKEGGANGRPTRETLQKMREVQLGKTHTEESKEKNRLAQLGRIYTECSKKKMRDVRLGITYTEETKKKMRDARLGKTHTEETKKKMRDARLGKTHTEETKRKLTGRTHTEEANKKNRDAHLGKTHTEVAKQNMRIAQLNKSCKNVCVFGNIYKSSKLASNAIRFLYGFKSNFIKKWVISPKYPDIFYVS